MADNEAVKIIQGVIDKCRARVGDKYDDWRMARSVELREAVDLLTAAPSAPAQEAVARAREALEKIDAHEIHAQASMVNQVYLLKNIARDALAALAALEPKP